MEQFLPWPIRYPNATLLALLLVLIAVSTLLWFASNLWRLRRRARAEMRFFGEPSPNDITPQDEALVVTRGHLVVIHEGKPLANGAEILNAYGSQPLHVDSGVSIDLPSGRVALVGPYRVLVGAREELPVGKGRRVLCTGDEVIVSGRWAVEKTGTTNYRDIVTIGAILPSDDVLEIASTRPPRGIGLSEKSIARGIALGAFLWAAALTGGAAAALEGARSVEFERNLLRLASVAYVSPFTRSNAQSLLLSRVTRLKTRDADVAEQWAAVESFLGGNGECIGALDNLRANGKFEEEARLGVACGGIASKRRAADAYVHLGEFSKAAEVLQTAPPPTKRQLRILDIRLDLRVAVMMRDFMGAAKLLRVHGHPSLTPAMQSCLSMALEARGGSFWAREQLLSKSEKLWPCALLLADLLDGDKRIAMLRDLPKELQPDVAAPLFTALRAEVDPTVEIPEFRLTRVRQLLDAPSDSHESGVVRALQMSTLARLEVVTDGSANLRQQRANLQAALGLFAAMVGDEPESVRLVDLALKSLPTSHARIADVQRLRAALAVRTNDPQVLKHVGQLEALGDLQAEMSIRFLRGAVAVRAGEGSAQDYYAIDIDPDEFVDTMQWSSGDAVLRDTPPLSLLRHLIIVAPRLTTERDAVVNRVRWYDPQCLDIPCSLEYLASEAAFRALVLRHLRAGEIGRGDDQRALEERARKLREPLMRRDIALILALLEWPLAMN